MKRYYIKYTRDFANTYDLAYTETPEQEEAAIADGYDRISRREAEALCAAEKERREFNPSFAWYAPAVILPYGYERDWRNDSRMVKRGYIIERLF